MSATVFSGYHESNFRIVDNRDFYRKALANPDLASDIGLSAAKARELLQFQEHFAGLETMARVVKVRVEPCSYALSVTRTQAAGVANTGKPLTVLDVHQLVSDRLAKLTETVLDDNKRIELADGTVVMGKHIQEGSDPGPLSAKRLETQYLDITYDATDYATDGSFRYSAVPRRKQITPANVIGFRVTKEISFNGELVETTVQEWLPIFSVERGKPQKLKAFKTLTAQRVLAPLRD